MMLNRMDMCRSQSIICIPNENNSEQLQIVVRETLSKFGFWSDVYLVTVNGSMGCLKVYKENKLYGMDMIQQCFQTEICALKRLRSESEVSFCELFAFGQTLDGFPFLVMEYCGIPIARTRYHPFDSNASVVNLFKQLQHAHKIDLIHCDLHADNILYNRERNSLKIVDWNCSRFDGSSVKYSPSVSSKSADVASFGKALLRWVNPDLHSRVFSMSNMCSEEEMQRASEYVAGVKCCSGPLGTVIPWLLSPERINDPKRVIKDAIEEMCKVTAVRTNTVVIQPKRKTNPKKQCTKQCILS